MIDNDTLKHLLRINDGLFQVCKLLNEKLEIEISSRLIPLVDELTHILLDEGKNKLHWMANRRGGRKRWLDGIEGVDFVRCWQKNRYLVLNEAVSHTNHATGIVKQYPDISTRKAAEC
jgi:hypothetical protein